MNKKKGLLIRAENKKVQVKKHLTNLKVLIIVLLVDDGKQNC